MNGLIYQAKNSLREINRYVRDYDKARKRACFALRNHKRDYENMITAHKVAKRLRNKVGNRYYELRKASKEMKKNLTFEQQMYIDDIVDYMCMIKNEVNQAVG